MKKTYLLLLVVSAFACSDKEEPSCASDLSAFTLEGNVLYTGERIDLGNAQLCPLADVTVTINGQQVTVQSDGDAGTADGVPYFIVPTISEATATVTVKAGKDEVTLGPVSVVKAYGTWKEVASFTGTGRIGTGNVANTTDGFLFGGNSWEVADYTYFSDLYKYNAADNAWTKVATADPFDAQSAGLTDNNMYFPGKVYSLASNNFSTISYVNYHNGVNTWADRYFTLKGDVYVITDLDEKYIEIQRYNKGDNTWTIVESLSHMKNGQPEYFEFDFAVEHDGKAYIGIQFLNSVTEALWSFDGTNLTSVSSVDTGLEGSTQSLKHLFTIDGLAYFVEVGEAFTDNDKKGSVVEPRSLLYVYNFTSNEWHKVKTEFPESLFGVSSLNIGNRGFAGMSTRAGTTLYVHSKKFYEFIPSK